MNYSFNTHYVKISEQSIIWAVENHCEKQLIFLLRLKRNYRNGYIQSPGSKFKDLGQGLTKRTYLRRIEQLISMGWAVRSKNGISLIAIDKLPVQEVKTHPKHLYLENNNTLTVVLLRNMISVISERVQKCKVKLSDKPHSAKRTHTDTLLTINGGLKKVLHNIHEDVSMSIRRLSEKLNRSRSTTIRQLNKARGLKMIKTYARYIFNPLAPTTYILFDGDRYQRIANQFETFFDKGIKKRQILSKLSNDERIVSMYCNDCF